MGHNVSHSSIVRVFKLLFGCPEQFYRVKTTSLAPSINEEVNFSNEAQLHGCALFEVQFTHGTFLGRDQRHKETYHMFAQHFSVHGAICSNDKGRCKLRCSSKVSPFFNSESMGKLNID